MVLFSHEGRVRYGRVMSVRADPASKTRNVMVSDEAMVYREKAEATISYAGSATRPSTHVFEGPPAICIQACFAQSVVF